MTILDEIYQYKLSEVAENKKLVSVEQLKKKHSAKSPCPIFWSCIKNKRKNKHYC